MRVGGIGLVWKMLWYVLVKKEEAGADRGNRLG